MVAWFKKFLFDETAFVGFVRALLIGGGAALQAGVMPGLEATPWGIAIMALGGFVRAGDKNKGKKNDEG